MANAFILAVDGPHVDGPAVDVLVVDDDLMLRETVSTILQAEHYVVRTAQDVDDALRAIAEQPAALVLLDLNLPSAEGAAVAAALRARRGPRQHPPRIAVLSGAPDAEQYAAAMQADSLITKPFDIDQFLAEVARLCQPRTSDLP
jgi:DNA-binding response OmpR family regulator